jgi:hypothetical protein
VSASPPILHEKLPLIEVKDAHVLAQVLADPGAATHIAARLSERVAVVVPGHLDALGERLRKMGHLPRVSGSR